MPQVTSSFPLPPHSDQPKTVLPVGRHPFYIPALSTMININKEMALERAKKTYHSFHYKVYCDGSSYEGGVGAAALLYKNDRLIKISKAHLGTSSNHMVYEAKLVSILLVLNLLTLLKRQLSSTSLIGLDNQPAICALNNQAPKLSHYLIDHIHTVVEKLHITQDKLQNVEEFHLVNRQGRQLLAHHRDIVDLRIQWIPGHKDFKPNEKADKHTKCATKGESSQLNELPKPLRHPLLASLGVTKQTLKDNILKRWKHRWKTPPQYCKTQAVDKTTPSKGWLKLVTSLPHAQASLLFQLRTSHISLNKHLFHIKHITSPACANCNGGPTEMVQHFLSECSKYHEERHTLQRSLQCHTSNLGDLLSNSDATMYTTLHSTKHLKQIFGEAHSAV